MAHRLLQFILGASVLLLVTALWRQTVLPAPATIRSELRTEPLQETTLEPAFQQTVDAVTYTIKPLYTYELYGLVVSKHNADTWWDSIHKEWNDQLNITDLCVVWGSNVINGSYRDIAFSSGQFVCNFSTRSSEAFAAFDQTAVSNNHLLTNNPQIAAGLRNVRLGDQIHIKGFLAEYSHEQGMSFKRGTSTVRTDTGNGACETVYVQDLNVLSRGGGPWHALMYVAVVGIVACIIGWFYLPIRAEI